MINMGIGDKIKRHLRYARTVLRHKWFVFLACRRFKITWQGIIHDWSKLTPYEWFPYVKVFGGKNGESPRDKTGAYDPAKVSPEFDKAWLHHVHHNPHHWQHWVLLGDSGSVKVLEMPAVYVVEMVADWVGAGMAYSGNPNPRGWYDANKHKMNLHAETRAFVETLMNVYYPKAG